MYRLYLENLAPKTPMIIPKPFKTETAIALRLPGRRNWAETDGKKDVTNN